jgi:hypothetical protein
VQNALSLALASKKNNSPTVVDWLAAHGRGFTVRVDRLAAQIGRTCVEGILVFEEKEVVQLLANQVGVIAVFHVVRSSSREGG